MTYEYLKKISDKMGTELEEEINEFILNNLIGLIDAKLDDQIEELIKDSVRNGITFHNCGMAMIDNSCYMCEKFKAFFKKEVSYPCHQSN